MRTTIRLQDELLQDLKAAAVQSGVTLTRLIEDAVRSYVSRLKSKQSLSKIRLMTVGGNRVASGVDLDDSASLFDLMDDRHDAFRR